MTQAGRSGGAAEFVPAVASRIQRSPRYANVRFEDEVCTTDEIQAVVRDYIPMHLIASRASEASRGSGPAAAVCKISRAALAAGSIWPSAQAGHDYEVNLKTEMEILALHKRSIRCANVNGWNWWRCSKNKSNC